MKTLLANLFILFSMFVFDTISSGLYNFLADISRISGRENLALKKRIRKDKTISDLFDLSIITFTFYFSRLNPLCEICPINNDRLSVSCAPHALTSSG